MDNIDTASRERFWNTLISLDGKDIQSDAKLVRSSIQYPKKLYRFRPASLSALDGLQSNKLFFASADHYDDPFDSHMYIDLPQIETEFQRIFASKQSWSSLPALLAGPSGIPESEIARFFSSLNQKDSQNAAITLLKHLRKTVQAEMQSICFSETGLNEQLWLKYADNHSGFVLEYDLTDEQAFLCGKKESCQNCSASNLSYPLYPVHYSNNKYNATSFAKNTLVFRLISSAPKPLQDALLGGIPPSTWERERVMLTKKKCHEHDEEWRMIYPGPSGVRPFICWRPSSITLGLRMSSTAKNLAITLSEVAGIPLIYECYTENGDLKRHQYS